MRRPFICGNWKMHKDLAGAVTLVKGLLVAIDAACYEKVDVGVAPSFVHLAPVSRLLSGTPVLVGAQDVFWEREGAYTGEVSPAMLRDLGCSFCIVGHSERRAYFGETDGSVNRKVKALLDAGITPIVCVGETLEERESGRVFDVVKGQLAGALEDVDLDDPGMLVIAYEPVWAIGTGKVATPSAAQEVHAFIRETLSGLYGGLAEGVRILYGGSVKPDNIAGLMEQPDIDGALVGGASLKVESFAGIVKKAGGF